MAELDFGKNSIDERMLLISFNNERPISAAQVAAVLRALDSDYREMTGRELTLARLEIGSTWLWIADAVVATATWIKSGAEVAKAIEDLGSFAKKLKDGLEPEKADVPGDELTISDNSVDKSIAVITKLSQETKSTIKLKKTLKTDLGVETLEIEVTSAEAKIAGARVRKKPKKHKAISSGLSRRFESERLSQAMRELPPASRDIEAVIGSLVEAHMVFGSTYVLEHVATTLEHEGRTDIADVIRRLLGRGQGQVHVET